MLEVNGRNIDGLPFDKLRIVNELLSFQDEPLLLHLSDENNNDIVSYWVDLDDECTRWLLGKVTKEELYLYLSGNKSLRDLFVHISSDYLFLVDYLVDDSITIKSIKLISSKLIVDKYYPKENSFYPLGLSDFYFNYLESNYYLNKLKEKSYIFNLRPTDELHGSTVGSEDAGYFLVGLTKSVKEYIGYEVHNIFKNIIPNPSTLAKFVNKVKERFSPRLPIVQYGSFEVGLAIDTTSINLEYNVDFDWKTQLIDGYKRDVLDVNYSSVAEATLITEKYDADTRKKIYEPFIKIIENPDIKITVKNSNRTVLRDYTFNPIVERVRNIVIPKPSKEEVKEKEEKKVRLYQFVVALEEGQDLSNIKIKDLKDNLLFGDEQPEAPYIIHSPFEYNGKRYLLKKEIKSRFVLNTNGLCRIYNSELELDNQGDKFKEVENIFKLNLSLLIDEYLQVKESDKSGIKVKSDARYVELEKHLR